MNRPIATDERRYLDDFIASYIARTPSSHRRRQQAWPALADSRASQGYFSHLPEPQRELWLATGAIRYPIVAERADGAEVWDIDGNRYLDFCLGFGVHLFGHRPAFVEEAVAARMQRGLPIAFQTDRSFDLAAAIAAMTGVERVSFCNTGAEAIMGALRLARAATGRRLVVVFADSYHGSYDAVLPAIGQRRGLIPDQDANTLILELGAEASLETIDARADEIAGILVEPVQAKDPRAPTVDFLRRLRALGDAKDIPLIFDEILIGFRIHRGGAQALLGIEADLVTYGKIIGGGMPIGVIAGKSRFLDQIDGGRWCADPQAPLAEKVWFSGTFSQNPLTLAVADAVAKRLLQAGLDLQSGLNARMAGLVERIERRLTRADLPVRIAHRGSMLKFLGSPRLWLLAAHLRMRGIYIYDGMAAFLSTAHRDEHLDRFEEAVMDSLEAMRSGGFVL